MTGVCQSLQVVPLIDVVLELAGCVWLCRIVRQKVLWLWVDNLTGEIAATSVLQQHLKKLEHVFTGRIGHLGDGRGGAADRNCVLCGRDLSHGRRGDWAAHGRDGHDIIDGNRTVVDGIIILVVLDGGVTGPLSVVKDDRAFVRQSRLDCASVEHGLLDGVCTGLI